MSGIKLKKSNSSAIPLPEVGSDKITMFIDESGDLQGKDETGTVNPLGGGGAGGDTMLYQADYGIDLTAPENSSYNFILFGNTIGSPA